MFSSIVFLSVSSWNRFIIVHQAQKLMDTQCCFNQDPFVRITHGNVVVETETIVGAGASASWNDPIYFLYDDVDAVVLIC